MESNSFYWLEESAQRLKVVQFRVARAPSPACPSHFSYCGT